MFIDCEAVTCSHANAVLGQRKRKLDRSGGLCVPRPREGEGVGWENTFERRNYSIELNIEVYCETQWCMQPY